MKTFNQVVEEAINIIDQKYPPTFPSMTGYFQAKMLRGKQEATFVRPLTEEEDAIVTEIITTLRDQLTDKE